MVGSLPARNIALLVVISYIKMQVTKGNHCIIIFNANACSDDYHYHSVES